jgi:hypothetical protein
MLRTIPVRRTMLSQIIPGSGLFALPRRAVHRDDPGRRP